MAEIPISMVEGDDLYPQDQEAQAALISWVTRAFQDAEVAKRDFLTRWQKFYKMYRSYAGTRKKGEWRSRAWMPMSFYIIETILPRIVAQLPQFNVYPVGPEDTEGAETMEFMLKWAAEQSDLYLELVVAFKSALMYGTGILKTLYDEKIEDAILRKPIMQPMMQQVPIGMNDIDGNPMMEEQQVGEQPTGEFEVVRQPYIKYQGPVAEAVDIANFFPAPDATSIDDAQYVIHRVFRSRKHIQTMIDKGVYKIPDPEQWDSFIAAYDYPAAERLASVGLGPGQQQSTSPERELIEILEVWTKELVIAVAGQTILLRAERNPFAHGEIPFVRIVDHLVPFEFWGTGELEPLEGIQDTLNALWNSRIDNVKLVLNTMFAVSMDYLHDPKDLVVRPGGVIRVREGVPIDQAIHPVELGEVTQSSYTEAAEVERFSEKVSGVSAYQMGTDSPALNRTATGVALISEQGNTRFAHKVRISELTGLKRLARHYGAILQQFMPEEMAVRIFGPEGAILFQTITSESLMGAFDYDVEAESASQTESIRREQTLSLFNMLVSLPEINRRKLVEDVLKTFGRKDIQDYMIPEEVLMQMYAQQAEMDAASSSQPPQ